MGGGDKFAPPVGFLATKSGKMNFWARFVGDFYFLSILPQLWKFHNHRYRSFENTGGLKLTGVVISAFPGNSWNQELASISVIIMQMTWNFDTNKISIILTYSDVFMKFWRLNVILQIVTSFWHLREVPPVKNQPYFL